LDKKLWYGEKLEQLKPIEPIKNAEIVEVDEMHIYIGNKKSEWIWIAVDRANKIFINRIIGTRGSKTGK
jgi:transposase-like protein